MVFGTCTRYWEQKVLIFVDVLIEKTAHALLGYHGSTEGVFVTLGKQGFCLFLYLT